MRSAIHRFSSSYKSIFGREEPGNPNSLQKLVRQTYLKANAAGNGRAADAEAHALGVEVESAEPARMLVIATRFA